MRIKIAGFGFVGKAVYAALHHNNEIDIVDPIYKNSQDYDSKPEAVIICVSTPESHDGSCDMTNVFDVIADTDPITPILIKSTISLEGWEYIKHTFPFHKICFSPEFLRAETATADFATMKYAIIGGDDIDYISYWVDFFNEQTSLWMPAEDAVEFSIYTCSIPEAITIKYAENSFLALKVSFFNQIYDYCKLIDADFETVRTMLCLDTRIGESHTNVTAERGWGGHCFPKDTAAILKTADMRGYDMSVLKSAVDYNKQLRHDELNRKYI